MADFSQMSDEQLAGCVSSAESGEAVAEMVSRYTGLVLALAGKYSGGADYEELVSDGLDALLSALRKYSPEKGSFSGFASVCVSNRMKNAVDRAKRRNERLEELADEDIPDSSPTPEELVIGREMYEVAAVSAGAWVYRGSYPRNAVFRDRGEAVRFGEVRG